MNSIEERAISLDYIKMYGDETNKAYVHVADVKELLEEQKKDDFEIIEMLIDILQTSKNYHLGITALDSDEEIIQKRKTRETALIRNIEGKIKRAQNFMKKDVENE